MLPIYLESHFIHEKLFKYCRSKSLNGFFYGCSNSSQGSILPYNAICLVLLTTNHVKLVDLQPLGWLCPSVTPVYPIQIFCSIFSRRKIY